MRVRLLKPETFKDEDLAEVSLQARFLFIGLWTLADREGRMEDRPKWIRAELLPYDPSIDIDGLLDELASPKAFLTRYEVEGRKFIQLTNFLKHQKPHPREALSLLPAPLQAKARPRPAKASQGAASRSVSVSVSVSDSDRDQGRDVEIPVTPVAESEPTGTPDGTPENNPWDFDEPATDSTVSESPDVQQIGGEIRLTPQALGIRTDPGNFAQVQLSHDLTALVMAIGDPDKDPKAEALALLHAISATPKGVKIETLDLRRVPSNWAAVTTHAAFKLAADHGVDLALVDGWRTARTPANAPEPKAPEMATASTEPRTCALCGGSLRSKGGLYICADSRAIGCTWMVRTDQPALKSNAA